MDRGPESFSHPWALGRWSRHEPSPPGDAGWAVADLGRLVSVHQGRRPRTGAGDADLGARHARVADTPARGGRRARGASHRLRAARRVEAVLGPGAAQL